MAKYSTGDSQDSQSEDESCQICGKEDGKLVTAKLEGTILTVCKECEPDAEHRDDITHEPTESNSPPQTTTDSISKESERFRPTNSDPHTNPDWIEEVEYGNTRTPYLISDYDRILQDALESADMTPEAIHEEVGVPVDSIESLLNNAAMSDEVGRKEIEAVEEVLDIELIDNV